MILKVHLRFSAYTPMKGMTQAGCDEKFGLMRGTVANWENGYAEPETEFLPAIADFFGVTIWALTNNLPLAG